MRWDLILAGVEPTTEGLRSAAVAHGLARATAARCVLVHAVRDVWSSPPSRVVTLDVEPYRQAVLTQARETMLAALRHAAPEGLTRPLEIRAGRPARVLRDMVRERAADLVVLGAKHHVAPVRWVGGSTAHEAARILDVPLLVAAGPAAGFRRVLGAVDLSEAAGPVIAAAEEIARLSDAALRFVHVMEPLPFTPELPAHILFDEFVERDSRVLRDTIWPRISLARAEHVVRRGLVEATISHEAQEWKADLLVVGSHGRGWADRLVLGSVTEGLLSRAPCSVLVLPVHEEFGTAAPVTATPAAATS
jgi:nucleotide-binding universal stress UspA family protein